MFYILGCSTGDKLDPLRWTGTQDGPFCLLQNRLEGFSVWRSPEKANGGLDGRNIPVFYIFAMGIGGLC